MNVHDQPCPLCHAAPGEGCRTPSGKAAPTHAAREGRSGAPTTLTPAQRSLRARIAAHAKWGGLTDEERRQKARHAQRGVLDGFRRKVTESNPDVTEPELTRMAEDLRKAHMLKMSYAASVARSKKKGRK